jgi:release factor glutamine methyltransferase
MSSIAVAIDEAARALVAAGFDEPRRRARRLIAAALHLSPAEVFARPERLLGAPERERIAKLLRRVIAHEPLSRIEGCREFWGLEFLLSADALDPRPETETLVEAVLAHLPERNRNHRFLDIGTGSGCLLLALLSEFRSAFGVGIDIAPGAALTARANAARLGFAARASFVAGNWAAPICGCFDAVVANPPYIATAVLPNLPREVREFDPRIALDGGIDGLIAFRAIAADLTRLLVPGGVFVAEIGAGQGDAVTAILRGFGLVVRAIAPDLAGIPRCVVATSILPKQRAKKVGMTCALV